jgi:hypothetical protein
VICVYVDCNRKGERSRGLLQPQVGALIAALLPPDADVDVVNETWNGPDWRKQYDLLFLSCLHSDFDRARQISHYWRKRGARTVFGGPLASTYPELCRPFFDAICIGDAEATIPQVYQDFCRGSLRPVYRGSGFDPARVPVPRLDLVADQQRLPLALELTRGCPFSCAFCALTAVGTRFHTRPIELVLRDLRQAQDLLKGRVPDYKLAIAAFWDNNIGGNLPYLRRLCDELARKHLWWGSSITFNALTDDSVVKALSRAGCRFLYVGLETFNPRTLASMQKYQNRIDQVKWVIDNCRKRGILVMSGLLLSATEDDLGYIERIPRYVTDVGLHVPTFICFECPIPGTPYFHELAGQRPPAFLPNALLRDFTGYTLVVRPRLAPVVAFVDAYKAVLKETYRASGRLRKLWGDIPALLQGGYWDAALVDLIQCSGIFHRAPHPNRTYLTATDVPPPETSTVPLTDEDFADENERRAIMDPWVITDRHAEVLGQWHASARAYVSTHH